MKPPWFLKIVNVVASLDCLQKLPQKHYIFAAIIGWIGIPQRSKAFQDFL